MALDLITVVKFKCITLSHFCTDRPHQTPLSLFLCYVTYCLLVLIQTLPKKHSCPVLAAAST